MQKKGTGTNASADPRSPRLTVATAGCSASAARWRVRHDVDRRTPPSVVNVSNNQVRSRTAQAASATHRRRVPAQGDAVVGAAGAPGRHQGQGVNKTAARDEEQRDQRTTDEGLVRYTGTGPWRIRHKTVHQRDRRPGACTASLASSRCFRRGSVPSPERSKPGRKMKNKETNGKSMKQKKNDHKKP